MKNTKGEGEGEKKKKKKKEEEKNWKKIGWGALLQAVGGTGWSFMGI